MQEWWTSLADITKVFYGMAAFFSVFFLWQILAAFMGLSGDSTDGDVGTDLSDVDSPNDFDHHDVVESSQAFKILSLRSLITFFTLFSWGSALFTTSGMPIVKAMGISALWGLAGMLAIAGIFYAMGKLTETGTKELASCKGQTGSVYLDIPSGGYGEIKTTVSGVVENVRAKNIDGEALPSGTQVRIMQVVGQTLVIVEKLSKMGDSSWSG